MKIYTSVSLELITPKVESFIDGYVKKWHKKNLAQADLPSMLGELTGYNLVSTDSYCGGFCDYTKKEIALNEKYSLPYSTTFHEIGHAIQAELERFEVRQYVISEDLYDEWQAESIAWQLYNRCFPDKQQDASKFTAYMDKDGWRFLIDWYGQWRQNDMEKHLTPLYQ